MSLRGFIVPLTMVSLIYLAASVASAQHYPNKPIRIVTGAAGGGVNFAARLIGQGLTAALGQPIVVDNRGGSGSIAADIVAKAPPDGYTVIFYGSTFWLTPLMQDHPTYDALADFLPVVLTNRSPNVLVINPAMPVTSVKELIALAKARPGELNFATGPTGSANHLSAELFKAMAGINVIRVPYKGSVAALTDLIAGRTQVMFPNATETTLFVKSGKLKALAITLAQPSALAPGLPTVAASGLPGYESAAINAMFAPARTPAPVINKLNQEIVRVLNLADTKEKFFTMGVEPVGGTPEELGAKVKAEIIRMGKVIKDAGIRAD